MACASATCASSRACCGAPARGSPVYDIAGRLESNPHLLEQHHLNKTTYARLFIGELLPRSVDRILYLDCDVVCTGEIAPLWRLASEVPVVGGVPDRLGEAYQARLGLPAPAACLNP